MTPEQLFAAVRSRLDVELTREMLYDLIMYLYRYIDHDGPDGGFASGLFEYIDRRFDEAFPCWERWLPHDFICEPADVMWSLFDAVWFESYMCDDASVRAFLADQQGSQVGGLWKLNFEGVEMHEAETMRCFHRFTGLRDLDEIEFGGCVFSSASFRALLEGGPLWDRVSTLDIDARFSGGFLGEEVTMEEQLELSRAFFESELIAQVKHLKIAGPLRWNDTASFMAESEQLAGLEALTLGSAHRQGLRLTPRHTVRVLRNPALRSLKELAVHSRELQPPLIEAFKDPGFLPGLTALHILVRTNAPDPYGAAMRSIGAARGPGFVGVRWVELQ